MLKNESFISQNLLSETEIFIYFMKLHMLNVRIACDSTHCPFFPYSFKFYALSKSVFQLKCYGISQSRSIYLCSP